MFQLIQIDLVNFVWNRWDVAIETPLRADLATPPTDPPVPAPSPSVTWTATKTQRRTWRVPGIAVKAILPIVVVALWWRGSDVGWWSAAVVPGPVKVVHTFGTLIANGSLPSNLLVSLRRALIGGAIGVFAGLSLGVASGLWRRAEEALDPTLQMMRTLPFLVLLPLFIVWFGIGETSKTVIIAMGSMFPMYLNTFAGIRNVDGRLVEMARTYQLNRAQLIRQVIVPGALPSVLTGLRYSLGVSWLALVVAEQINARNGLGYLIYNAQEFFEANVLLVVIVVYAALGLATDLAVRLLERSLLTWRRGFVGS
jgi:sulfonate transport system permease protein